MPAAVGPAMLGASVGADPGVQRRRGLRDDTARFHCAKAHSKPASRMMPPVKHGIASCGVSAASASLNVVVDASKKILVAAHAGDKCRCLSPASCAAHSHRHEGSDDSWERSNRHLESSKKVPAHRVVISFGMDLGCAGYKVLRPVFVERVLAAIAQNTFAF